MKTSNKFALLIVFLFASQCILEAQTVKTLRFEEAIAMGISNSKVLKVDEAKVDQSLADLVEAKNQLLPNINLSGSYLRLAKANVNFKIPTGSAEGGSVPDVSSALYGSANLSWPIFAGGRIQYGIQSAKYLVEASKLDVENQKDQVAYTIAEAYNNLFKANKAIEVLEESLRTAQARDSSFLKLEQNGILARNDRLKAQLQTSDIELQLLDAKNNYAVANINMDLLLGLPEETQIEVDSNYLDQNNTLEANDYYLEQAFKNRKDIQALDLNRKAASLQTKSAKSIYYPTIALTGGYVAADIPKVLSVTNALNAGIGIQYNLSNLYKKNSGLMRSKSIEKQLEANNDLLSDQVTLAVKRDFQNDVFANRKTEVFERALAQAEENYRITHNKFDNGLATMTELLDADTARLASRVNLTNSKADASLAHKKLLQTSGLINQ